MRSSVWSVRSASRALRSEDFFFGRASLVQELARSRLKTISGRNEDPSLASGESSSLTICFLLIVKGKFHSGNKRAFESARFRRL